MAMDGKDQPAGDVEGVAELEYFSGPQTGSQALLFGETVDIVSADGRHVTVSNASSARARKPKHTIARLRRSDGTYRLKVTGDRLIWINGRRIDEGELIDRDIIEFGQDGPLSRFRLTDKSTHSRRDFTDVCMDCWDYLKNSRKPLPYKLARAAGTGLRRLAVETSYLFRTGVVAALLLLAFLTYQQQQINRMQQAHLSISQQQLDAVAQSLVEAREEAVTPSDLEELSETLSTRVSSSLDRLETLERQATYKETVIANTAPSVVFLQGAFGYREAEGGRVLRHVVNAAGQPLIGPGGTPLLSLEGEGPPAERQFTGTGFAVADGKVLATNRHVALPWESGGAMSFASLEPYLVRFVAYAPGSARAVPVEFVAASDDADLALLRLDDEGDELTPLKLAETAASQGESLLVVGYPTGLRSILARSGAGFVEKLKQDGVTDFWAIAERLASENRILPLTSFGIVSQREREYLVYDAATAQGGSGGPVVNSRGQVVAVNAAILPKYGGSNLGVPVERLLELIEQADLDSVARLN